MNVKFVLRSLIRTPGFTAAVVLTIAIGIAAATAVLSVGDAVFFHPIIAPALDRLIVIRQDVPALKLSDALIDGPSAEDLIERRDLFEDAAAFESAPANLEAPDGEMRRVSTIRTLGDQFGLMDSRAAVGKYYTPAASNDQQRVAVIGYNLWAQYFHKDSSVVGREILLNDAPYLVLGVASQSLRYPRGADIFVPEMIDSRFQRSRGRRFNMTVLGRLRAGVSLHRLNAGLQQQVAVWSGTVGRRAYGGLTAGLTLRPTSFVKFLAGEMIGITQLLTLAVVILLVVVCGNVACLELVRAVARERELAIRAALGAGRGSLGRLVMLENVMLSIAGGALGVGAATGAVWVVRIWGQASFPQLAAIRVDLLVVAVISIVALVTAGVCGSIPMMRVFSVTLYGAVQSGTRGTSRRLVRNGLLRAAVVVQLAMALTLTLGFGLLVRGFERLVATSPGFDSREVLTAQFSLPRNSSFGLDQQLEVFDHLIARLRGLRGVGAVGIVTFLPFSNLEDNAPFSIVGDVSLATGSQPNANYNIVSEDYFRALGIPLLHGRSFVETDNQSTVPVAIVDQALAHEFFPGSSPIGRHLQWGGTDYEIVGVVGPVANSQLGERPRATIYFSFRQSMLPGAAIVVKGAAPLVSVAELMRAALAEGGSKIPIYDVRSMDSRVQESVGGRRLAAGAVGAFAMLAVTLAGLGVYAVLNYAVRQRRRELGIRAALGASQSDIFLFVLKSAGSLGLIGIASGLVVSIVTHYWISRFVYALDAAHEPFVVAGAIAVICGIVLIAGTLPARWASRVDPATALLAE